MPYNATALSALVVLFLTFHTDVAVAELALFGGASHDVFLGCIDCSKFSSGSICNEFGKGNEFGESIFNEFGVYGSEFSSSSPWNEFSSSKSVPAIVDDHGKFYGYLTINTSRADAAPISGWLKQVYEDAGADLRIVRKIFCDSISAGGG